MKKYGLLAFALCGLVLAGCHRDMWVQEKVKPQSKSKLFSDNEGTRIEPKGAVAFGEDKSDVEYYTGYTADGKLVKEFPIKITKDVLERGQERFTIFCTPCHGQLGNGKGMIAERGFNAAYKIASHQTDRMKKLPVGHIFDVMTNGYGVMYPFAARIPVADRWAIAAYIRVLQKSQGVSAASLTPDQVSKVESGASTLKKPEEHSEGEEH